MTLFWTKTWEALAGAVFPTPCVSCQELIAAHDPPLCAACWQRLPLLDGAACRCGAPLPGAKGEECGRCRRGHSVISAGASLGLYAGPLRQCVVALKYHGRHRTAARLGVRMLAHDPCRGLLDGANVLVPVPLHEKRMSERGFNQAELLAAALSRDRDVRISTGLIRVRDTPSQTDLSAGERRQNVRNAFRATPSADWRGAVVVLVDDVTTTGATLRECARTLLSAGALEVRSITVARAE